ncbi:hypothetical protein [Cellvibrio sp.]|uniref:hypothetical protein n=1 Tax=Cellvibrio sp. TaxID=1965322 RepID=UPI003964798A
MAKSTPTLRLTHPTKNIEGVNLAKHLFKQHVINNVNPLTNDYNQIINPSEPSSFIYAIKNCLPHFACSYSVCSKPPPPPCSRFGVRKTPASKYPNRQRKQLGLRIRFICLRLTLGGVIFLNETLSMRLIAVALILAGIGIVIREK